MTLWRSGVQKRAREQGGEVPGARDLGREEGRIRGERGTCAWRFDGLRGGRLASGG